MKTLIVFLLLTAATGCVRARVGKEVHVTHEVLVKCVDEFNQEVRCPSEVLRLR